MPFLPPGLYCNRQPLPMTRPVDHHTECLQRQFCRASAAANYLSYAEPLARDDVCREIRMSPSIPCLVTAFLDFHATRHLVRSAVYYHYGDW